MDCCLPADFFLADDARRPTRGDYELGADAHVHLDAPAFVTGLRDWAQGEPARPRGTYPGVSSRRRGLGSAEPRAERDRRTRDSADAVRRVPARALQPVDAEWRPL